MAYILYTYIGIETHFLCNTIFAQWMKADFLQPFPDAMLVWIKKNIEDVKGFIKTKCKQSKQEK